MDGSEWFTDVQQALIEWQVTMSTHDYIGYLSTVSAYLVLPLPERQRAFSRILRVLPDRVEMTADITLHPARRRHPGHHLDHEAPHL
ncbi:hypothetical protein ACIQXA_33815 [Streptomyces massasporeus]|uniref:hypothetical protein n=1 Tax=Streptomyces massasporeus TaxID=67324 RepID=UPI003823BCA0